MDVLIQFFHHNLSKGNIVPPYHGKLFQVFPFFEPKNLLL